MPYLVNPNMEDRCVLLTWRGNMTLAEMKAAWRGVHTLLDEFGWNRILVDATALKSDPDTGELFDLAKLLWQNLPQSARIALLVGWEQSTFAKLLETLVRSVGVYLTVFVSEKMAEAWIAENSKNTHWPVSDLFPKTAAQSDLSKGSLLCHVL